MLRKSLCNPSSALISALSVAAITWAAAGARAETGRQLFEKAGCVLCHGENGDGRGPVAAAIPDRKPRNFELGKFKFDTDGDGRVGSNSDLRQVIQQGALAFGGSAIMTPNPALSEQEIDSLVLFLRSLKR